MKYSGQICKTEETEKDEDWSVLGERSNCKYFVVNKMNSQVSRKKNEWCSSDLKKRVEGPDIQWTSVHR